MIRLLALLLAINTLAGCSSTPTANPDAPQYCETSEQIDVVNGKTVTSKVFLECSDSPVKRAKLAGVDPKSCRSWEKQIVINGVTKNLYGYLCRDENGNWRPLNQY
jgi:hypothetical protein